MDQTKLNRWVMQTATRWEDLTAIVNDTEIEKIDQEHRHIIRYILDMETISTSAAGSAYDFNQLKSQILLIEQLLVEVTQHFSTEEYFIDKYQLPGKNEQINQHESILTKINSISGDFNEGIVSTFGTMKMVLLDEMINHINKYDTETFKLENFTPALTNAREWKDVSEIIKTTGIPFVDDEHKQLTRQMIGLRLYLVEVNYEIQTEQQKNKLLSLIDEFYAYTKSHFDHEIHFLEAHQLPIDSQSAAHDEFSGKVLDKINRITSGAFDGMDDFVNYMFNWWIHHINGTDYTEFHYMRIIEAVFDNNIRMDDLEWLVRKTGIDEVDDGRLKIFNSILQLSSLEDNDSKGTDIEDILSNLCQCVELHFNSENKFMVDKNIKGYKLHKESHRKLLLNISEATSHIVSGRSKISPSFVKRLMLLFVGHTNSDDYETFVLNAEKR
ncbi:MAG: hemerythrin domain-containing protein [Sedimenticola sp.]